MSNFIGGTEKVALTEGLLHLIIMVQDYKRAMLSKYEFDKSHNGKSDIDWNQETIKFFNNLDSAILRKYMLSKNLLSYEKVILFKVTKEMKSTLYKDLPTKFTF